MPKSNGRPLNRISHKQWHERFEREDRQKQRIAHVPGLSVTEGRRADRRDYRQTLIHRLATAHGDRKTRLEQGLQEVEQQIRELKEPVAA